MRLRLKKNGTECSGGNFNLHSISEIIVYFEDGGADSDYISNYDVWLENAQAWKSLSEAFRDHDVIVDDLNTRFFEPKNDEERAQGYR